MKPVLTAVLGLGIALSLPAAEESPYKTTKEKGSYALGMNIGKSFRQNNFEVDMEIFLKAFKEALSGGKLLMTDEQMREAAMALQSEARSKSLEKNKKDGEAFLAENKKKDGVITTSSGLQYKIETKGTGKVPKSNDTVVCHYRGTLIDGTDFDNSYKRGEPTPFSVTGVIKGWTEALVMMPVGSKWKLFIPSELAYGERGNRGIAPNSTLQFDIELISIKDPSEAAATATPAPVPAPGAVSRPIQIQPQAPPKPK